MLRARIVLAAGALIALAGCVTNDPYYGYADSGYSSGYGSNYSYPYADRSYSYDRGRQYSYDNRQYYDQGSEQVHCNLPGKDQVMSRRDCRHMQRQYGSSEREAELRAYR